jgi:hypothetical protein
MWGTWGDDVAPIVPPPEYEAKDSGSQGDYYAREKSEAAVATVTEERPVEQPQRAFVNFSHRVEIPNSAHNTNQPAAINTNVPPGSIQFGTLNSAMAVTGDRSPTDTLDSNGVSIYSDMAGTMGEGTYRSRMPDKFFNQSELARQPSDAYDPARRQVNRVSELSSLSSGFGDGDIIVPNQLMPGLPARPQGQQPQQPTRRLSGRFLSPMASGSGARTSAGRFSSSRFSSWFSPPNQQQEQPPPPDQQQRRDTVYTEASEDSPPRFRTVNSWVNQQTGRVKRGLRQQSTSQAASDPEPPVPVPALPGGQIGVPGVANAPPDPYFGLMMDDEPPRPVDLTGLVR